jgi:hypothetical protein
MYMVKGIKALVRLLWALSSLLSALGLIRSMTGLSKVINRKVNPSPENTDHTIPTKLSTPHDAPSNTTSNIPTGK